MVHRTYCGLGPPERAVVAFENLTPYAAELLALRRECPRLGPDDSALGIACDGLQTAAYHFTRRRHFYHALETRLDERTGNGRLSDTQEAFAAFEALRPYAEDIRRLMTHCRPFGRDYLALKIALDSLETAAFHFTREAHFYGSKSDSAGPIR